MSEELNEIKWFSPYDKKMHAVRIDNGSEDGLDFNLVIDTMDSVVKSQEDECRKIYQLGLALTGNPSGARGFLDGWLCRSLKPTFEEKHGKWTIQHETEKLSNAEIKNHIVEMLRETADKLENDEDFDAKNAPIVQSRDNGTELFD